MQNNYFLLAFEFWSHRFRGNDISILTFIFPRMVKLRCLLSLYLVEKIEAIYNLDCG